MSNKVLLCQFDNLEFYSYMILSTQLAKNGVDHDIEIIDDEESFYNDLSDKYMDFDVIGFYACNADNARILRLTLEIKKRFRDRTVVLGGPNPTLNYESIDFNLVDFVCIGDGEFHFADWISGKHYKEKKNYYNIVCNLSEPFDTKFVIDFNNSPFPSREIYYRKYPFLRNMGVRRFLFSTGCPFKCAYCHNESFRTKFKDNYYKTVLFRDPEKAISEMESVLSKYPADAVSFSDDNFCINKKWLFSFLKLYSERINKPFNMASTVNVLKSDVIDKLHTSNLNTVRIAMETTNERIRREILRRPNYTNEEFAEVAGKLYKNNVKLVMLNMFCLPTQTLKDCADTFRFAKKNKVIMCTNILVPYKGTSIYKYCLENNLLVNPSADEGDIYASSTYLKGEEMPRMVTMQNYTFVLNFVSALIPFISFLSKFKAFRTFSLKLIAPINVIGMNYFAYRGLFSFTRLFKLGIKTFSSFKRKS